MDDRMTVTKSSGTRYASRDVGPSDKELRALLRKITDGLNSGPIEGLQRIAAGGVQDCYDATVAHTKIDPSMET